MTTAARLALLLSLASAAALADPAPTVAARPVLTLEQALSAAQQHQPSLRQARAGTEAARARVGQARAPLLPQLDGALSYQRTTANFTTRPGLVPRSLGVTPVAPSFATYNFFSASLSASQQIYDFGRSFGKLRSAEASADAQKESQRTIEQQALLDVRSGYFGARAQKSLLEVAQVNLANAERHLVQVSGFVQIGTRPAIDLAQARTDRANARAQLIAAQNGYELSKARLNQAMGVEGTTEYDVADESMPPLAAEDVALEELLGQALKTRPELASQEAQIRSQRESVSAAFGGWWPSLALSTQFNDVGTTLQTSAWNWNAQVSLNWPLFDGLLTANQVKEARANLASAEAQRDGLRLQVRLDVEQAQRNVRAAKEALVAAREAETSASERLQLAEGRYQAGAGSIIELGDAQTSSANASAQRVGAEYDLATARAALLRALGE